MKATLFQPLRRLQGTLWAVIVAYMLGIHNFYKGEDKTPADMAPTTELNEAQKNSSPKD